MFACTDVCSHAPDVAFSCVQCRVRTHSRGRVSLPAAAAVQTFVAAWNARDESRVVRESLKEAEKEEKRQARLLKKSLKLEDGRQSDDDAPEVVDDAGVFLEL